MAIPALVPAVMACIGVNEIVAEVAVALTEEASVIARPLMPLIKGNVPVAVVSMMTGVPADESPEVPAAMLAKAACPAVGLVSFVTVKVMTVAALKVPTISLTVNTEPANETVHAGDPEEGAVTAQTLESKAMPEPDSVMAIPALAPAVIAVAGVNEIVAVVAVALRGEASVTASPLMAPAICGKVPVYVVSLMTGLPAEKSLEVPAAMLAKAACTAVGVVNFVMVKVTTDAALKVPSVLCNQFTSSPL